MQKERVADGGGCVKIPKASTRHDGQTPSGKGRVMHPGVTDKLAWDWDCQLNSLSFVPLVWFEKKRVTHRLAVHVRELP